MNRNDIGNRVFKTQNYFVKIFTYRSRLVFSEVVLHAFTTFCSWKLYSPFELTLKLRLFNSSYSDSLFLILKISNSVNFSSSFWLLIAIHLSFRKTVVNYCVKLTLYPPKRFCCYLHQRLNKIA